MPKIFKNLVLLIIFSLLLIISACNSGNNQNNSGLKTSQNYKLSSPSQENMAIAPFTGERGWDSIHNKMAELSCFSMPQSFYVTLPESFSSEFYYVDNVNRVMDELKASNHVKFHDNSNLIVEKDQLNLNSEIKGSLETALSSGGLTIVAKMQATQRVYYFPSISTNGLESSLNTTGMQVYNTASILASSGHGSEARRYFISECGNSLITQWKYSDIGLGYLTFTSDDISVKGTYDVATKESVKDSSSVGPSNQINDKSHFDNILQAMTGTINVNVTTYATGGVVPPPSQSTCQFRNEADNGISSYSLGDCQELIDGFFSSMSSWASTGMPTSQTQTQSVPPVPGMEGVYLGGQWDGSFHTHDITVYINQAFASNTINPDNSLYADQIASLENLITKSNQYVDYIKVLESTSSFYCNSNCRMRMMHLKNQLNYFINFLTSNNIEQNIQNYCLINGVNESSPSGPDTPQCNNYLKSIYKQLNDIFPYEGLLYFQNSLSNTVTVEQYLPLPSSESESFVNSFQYLPNMIYEYYPTSGNNSILSPIPGKMSINNSYKIFADYQNISSNYLYMSPRGDAVSVGFTNSKNQNFRANIYLGNGESSSAFLAVSGSPEIPLKSNYKTSYSINQLFNLDGYFKGSNNMNFETFRFKPNEYLYSDVSTNPNVQGYLVICEKDYSLDEYALVNTKYSPINSLIKVWEFKPNPSTALSSLAIKFNTSTGEFKIYDIYSSSNAEIINPADPNYSDDGIRRFALNLSTDGVLAIYRAGNNTPVWSNAKYVNHVNPINTMNPNVDRLSFWYTPSFETENSSGSSSR